MSTSGRVWPIDGASRLPAAAGGKARGLAGIAEAGLEVPAAWAVLPGVSAAELAALGGELRRRGIARVAVRSSAGDEDGAQHSFAGIHETELEVPTEALAAAAGRVASSPLSERAQAYRRQHGLPAATGPGAVIVQAMVDADWAGVAFGKGDGVLVEAVEGLGEVAVNGDATPEQLELSAEGGRFRVTRRWLRKQPFAVRPTGKGTERVTLEGARPTLPEAVALEVAAGVAALEHALGKPLDVEWAATGGKVAFLQARPQTRPIEAALPPGQTWTRANIADTFPEIASALARDLYAGMLSRAAHEVLAVCGVPLPREMPLCVVVAGRMIFNEQVFNRASGAMGVPPSWGQVVQGGAGEGTNAYVMPDLRKLLGRLDLIVKLYHFVGSAERRARLQIGELRAAHERRAAVPATGQTDSELLEGLVRVMDEGLNRPLIDTMRLAGRFQVVLTSGAMVLRAHAAPAALIARLVDPEQLSVTTRQLEEQVEIARAMRQWQGARAFLEEIGPRHAAAANWAGALPATLWRQIEAWLAEFGHRCPNESDPAQARIGEDLRHFAAALRPLVLAQAEPESREARRARRRVDSAEAWEEVSARFGALARWRLRGPARELARLTSTREELRSAEMLNNQLVRRYCLELGRRMVARRQLDAADDVFHLTLDELGHAARDPARDARTAVARERARVAAWRRIEVPNRFSSEEVTRFRRVGAAAAGGATLLRGTAVSPGVVEGRACVLRTADDEARLALGGILVAPSTDPGWTPLFARAAGVVVELGGVMSHSATVAREYGLPCVSNVDGAVATLRDGDLLRVDGTHGTVEIVERAGERGQP
jgi:pyruvate,water dikinase